MENAWEFGAMSEWQDISTAPKDGTKVDLWAVSPDGNDARRIPNAVYESVTDWLRNERLDWFPLPDVLGIKYRPTHWMPLPEPPKMGEEE